MKSAREETNENHEAKAWLIGVGDSRRCGSVDRSGSCLIVAGLGPVFAVVV